MFWLSSFVIEFLFYQTFYSSKVKRILAIIVGLYVLVSTATLISWLEPGPLLVIGALLPFRLLNIARVIKARMHPHYLIQTTTRTGIYLALYHALALIFIWDISVNIYQYVPFISLIGASSMFALLALHLYKTRHIPNTNHYSDKELPTVSVCIPARNETDALEQCLQSIIANDYPKLEILVLDDCSQDKTAEVIKSFAQDGVRFIQGDEPQERWLAKNQAYDKLAKEANGELILFCGVDVRFGTHAIRALVTTLLNRKKSMISVLPLRFYSKATEAFLQPMRYWWELVPPRKLFRRPAVLSTCWLVNRKKLEKAGGFGAVSHTVIPEGFFARHFIKTDSYSFIRSDEELDVRTTKPFTEQWATALRTNYPQIRRRPEVALFLTLFTLLFLIGPFVMLALSIIQLNIQNVVLFSITCSLLTATHLLILQISDPANVPLGFVTLPIAASLEIIVGYTSLLKYEFGRIDWKDRNVCIPVMHTVPKKDFLANGSIK